MMRIQNIRGLLLLLQFAGPAALSGGCSSDSKPMATATAGYVPIGGSTQGYGAGAAAGTSPPGAAGTFGAGAMAGPAATAGATPAGPDTGETTGATAGTTPAPTDSTPESPSGAASDPTTTATSDEPMGPEEEAPECELPSADEFQPNDAIGGGGPFFEESDHFRVFGGGGDALVALNHLEAAHQCFIEDWCFRSTGLAVERDTGPYYKFNTYAVGSLGGAAGVMRYDAGAGLSYLEVITRSLADPQVTVHEYGHAITLTEYGWVEQQRTGAWWETVANWFSDTYLTSRFCAPAREAHGVAEGQTIIDLRKNISESWRTIVDDQNYYQAWPFLTYLTHNPDKYPGLGRMALPDLFRNHPGNNDTPLHVLADIAEPIPAQTILGRYWARMAYLDIGHPQAQEVFFGQRARLDYANLDSVGNQTYRVKSSKQPRYGGANIIPLTTQGAATIEIEVSNLGNGQADSNFTATLAIRAADETVRYVDLPEGSGNATVASGEEASLVVANTPDTLYQYDAFASTSRSPESIGLNYEVRITGATPSN